MDKTALKLVREDSWRRGDPNNSVFGARLTPLQLRNSTSMKCNRQSVRSDTHPPSNMSVITCQQRLPIRRDDLAWRIRPSNTHWSPQPQRKASPDHEPHSTLTIRHYGRRWASGVERSDVPALRPARSSVVADKGLTIDDIRDKVYRAVQHRCAENRSIQIGSPRKFTTLQVRRLKPRCTDGRRINGFRDIRPVACSHSSLFTASQSCRPAREQRARRRTRLQPTAPASLI